MDYEKEYKEALKRALFVKENTDNVGAKDVSDVIEYIFSELKESEDEKIRKELIDFFSDLPDTDAFRGIAPSKIIAWLEKQGEQKPADKVEPKFKVGDWIVDKSGFVQQVLDFRCGIYTCTYNSFTISCESDYHLWTIQDAKDGDVLQLGEVTAIFKKYIGNELCTCYCSFCNLGGFEIPIAKEDNVYGCYDDTTPATKEQRDILFAKMKEAGYEWDAEKKELKKIEQKPTIEMITPEESLGIDSDTYNKIVDECIYGEQKPAWSEEDERLCSCLIEEQEESLDNVKNDKYGHSEIISDLKDMYRERINWLKSLKDRVQPTANKEWSENDKGKLLDIKCIIDKVWHNQDFREDVGYSTEELESLWNWLDNIWQRVKYPQNIWKPSEEQMEALAEALSLAKNCGEESAFDLRTLHEQLKKLKEE